MARCSATKANCGIRDGLFNPFFIGNGSTPSEVDNILLENGTEFILLENDVDKIQLEI